MRSIDDLYIVLGLCWLIFGLAFGIWMGINEEFQFISVHAHINLVGFVISVAFGLILRAYPDMKTSKLLMPQLLLWQVGTVILIIGKAVVATTGDPRIVATGSLVVLLGAVLFLIIFAKRRASLPAAPGFSAPR